MRRSHVFGALAVGFASAAKLDFLESGKVHEAQARVALQTELSVASSQQQSFTEASDRLEEILHSMSTMYKSLPKGEDGKLNHQAVRYALHRYFVRRHGWYVRGLAPQYQLKDGVVVLSHNGSSMEEWVPSYLMDNLEQMTGEPNMDLAQLSALAATVQDLIWMEATERLGTAYAMYNLGRMSRVTREEADSLIRTYYIAFLNSWEFMASTRDEAEANVGGFINDYDGWSVAKKWLADLSTASLRPGGDDRFLFEGVARLVSKIGEEYYFLNDKECEDLKDTLHKLEGRPGRVRLSAFYHKSMYSHWEFSEKRSYLRRLGVLDESDPRHPSVIIANYVMARPNCLEASNLYAICCRNECEDLMGSLERRIEGSTASPTDIIAHVANLPSVSVQAPRQLDPMMLVRLGQIAEKHGGEVPLHGRLFAQWMHHAYPLECPYPHERGTASPLTRSEWIAETGSTTQATLAEKHVHISNDLCQISAQGGVLCREEDTHALPWSENEELLSDPEPGQGSGKGAMLATSFVGAVLLGVCALGWVFLHNTRRRRMAMGSESGQTYRDPLE